MVKMGVTRIAISLPRLVIGALLVGVLVGGAQLLPQPSQAQPLQPQTTAAQNPAPYTAVPQTVTQPAPPTPPVSTPIPKPIATVHVTHATKAAPVVKPAPAASVTGLKPTGPTTSPTSSGGSSPSSPPATTTAYTSTNWSGYMATTGVYTGVSGSWAVPSATGTGSRSSMDAAWIGIGGVISGDLIQVGTMDTVSRSGTQTSSAFYEMLPAASKTITSLHVSPGDVMSASLTEVSSGQWAISLTDTTTGKSYTSTVAYSSSHSSAEWIEEDPSTAFGSLIPLDNFGTVSFSGSTATTASGVLSLTGSNAQPITMVSGTTTIATPSGIGPDSKSFTVTRH